MMSKLYAGFLLIASMLALSAFGFLGFVLITHLIDLGADVAAAIFAWVVCIVTLASLCLFVVFISRQYKTISQKCFHTSVTILAATYAI